MFAIGHGTHLRNFYALEYTLDIHANDLDTVAAPTYDNMLRERYDGVWQLLPVAQRTYASGGISLCIHNA